MKDWSQPICPVCFAAWSLGAGKHPLAPPVRAIMVDDEPCLICATPNNGIYVRVDPKLTEGLLCAREKVVS